MKSQVNIIRAWTDEAYRNSLTDAERAALPACPEGMTELSGEEAAARKGGFDYLGGDPDLLGGVGEDDVITAPGAVPAQDPEWDDAIGIGADRRSGQFSFRAPHRLTRCRP